MTRVIAFSWPGNTQKSSLINGHYEWEKLISPGIGKVLLDQGKSVKIYNETARGAFDVLKEQWLQKFQEQIFIDECVRVGYILKDIREETFDVILIDRTFHDNFVYTLHNYLHNKIDSISHLKDIDEQIYDDVILLNKPTKSDSKEEFDTYNTPEFHKYFEQEIKWKFKDKVRIFANGKEDWKRIFDYIKGS